MNGWFFPSIPARILLFTVLATSVQADSLRIVADTGQQTPDGGGEFISFSLLSGNSPVMGSGSMVFVGHRDQDTGIYAEVGGELVSITNTSTPPQGFDAPFGVFFAAGSHPAIDGQNVVFSGADEVGFDSEFMAIWARIDGVWRSIAQSDEPAPNGETFVTFRGLNGVSPSISGENIAFGAVTTFSTGIFAYIDGSLRLIADTNTPVPGGPGTFLNFGLLSGTSPSICGSNVAFGGCTEDGQGIYAYIDGSLQVIADTKTRSPDGGTFVIFAMHEGASPAISGQNIAFGAQTTNDFNGHAIFAYIEGSLQLIVDNHTDVPGGVGPFTHFGLFSGAEPSISGENVAFGAKIPSRNGNNGWGIYAYIDGALRTIADTDTIVPGRDVTFSSFRLTQGTSPAIDGEEVVFGGSSWGGEGLYASIPDHSADLDGDGTVGTSDLLILFANWGPCEVCEACTADLDGNCTVGVSDLLILFSNWG
ncbi:MAG: hypothetical protein IH984_11950 [Planctomycetes bacterium]|nr:hypothetical protein [Planctomycetota bacterium]